MQLDPSVLDEFFNITGKDIRSYFTNASIFFSGDYNTIVNYYSGTSQSINSTPFANFTFLQNQNKDIFETWKEHSRQFNNLKWYLLLEQIEEIDSRLKTLANINKWARSSLTSVAYDPSVQVGYIMKANETLESVSANLLNSTNPNDDWTGIAIANNLAEEGYTPDGGTTVNVKFQKVNNTTKITSVVDVIVGKSIYGKDIDKCLHFDSDANDLAVLDYDDTILQAADILIHLRKNDNPDNPSAGLQSGLIAGSNRALLNFPAIIRQLSATFSGDDSLQNFKVNTLSLDQDNLLTNYYVETRIGNPLNVRS